jgi:hypothetical protein
MAVATIAVALLSPTHAATKKKKPEDAPPAAAAVPAAESRGCCGDRGAHRSPGKARPRLYHGGAPQKSEAAGTSRKPPMAMVTHRPAENIANVVSFVEGYPLKEGSDVELEIGDRKFELFTKDDSAWARTAELDRTIVGVLGKGKSAVVKGMPQKGRPTTDIYALAGFSKALALIDKACGLKRQESGPAKHAPKRKTKPKPAPG